MTPAVRTKVCGITREQDAFFAAEAGADFIGFIFAESPRRVEIGQAASIAAQLTERFPSVGRVGVFVHPERGELIQMAKAVDLTHLQIYGPLPSGMPDRLPWIAALRLSGPDQLRIPEGDPWAVLVEPKVPGMTGGTGQRFPWHWVKPILEKTRVFVAGGLSAASIEPLLATVTPFGVDASSGLEQSPGVKDPIKVRAFIEAVRGHTARKEDC